MQAPPAEVRDLRIESIAAGGDGVGRSDGLVIFTPRTAPGDVARIAVTPMRGGRFGRGRLLEVLSPSPERVAPACRHFVRDRCGGCQLQHIGYDAQIAAKSVIVHDALDRIARRPVVRVDVAASPQAWRYRRKLTLALRRRGAGRWMAGLHRFDDPGDIFALEECPITEDAVVAVWQAVMAVTDLLPDAPELRAAVRRTSDGFAFVVEGGRHWPTGARFAAAIPSLTEVWWTPDHGSRRAIYVARDERERTAEVSQDRVMAAPSGASFVQVNAAMSDRLHNDLVSRVLAHAPTTAVDAYAGTGTTAVALARVGVRVTAIEADSVAAAHCRTLLPAGSRCVAGLVEDALPGALPADVVLLNPPRSGLAASVAARLETAGPSPRAVFYVSCDPATLARDLARLGGWRIAHVQGYDMFPQTAHVETLCELVPERAVA